MNKVRIKEEHLQQFVNEFSFTEIAKDPTVFILTNRFDLGFKLCFLDNIKLAPNYAREIYYSHINAFTLGTFKEPGNENKTGFDVFVDDFLSINSSIQNNGFISNISSVPISSDGSILNGAHRVSSAIFNSAAISVTHINHPGYDYGFEFFKKRSVHLKYLDSAAITLTKYKKSMRAAIIWPIAEENYNNLIGNFKGIIYEKKVRLSARGMHNLICGIYKNEYWLGTPFDGYKGAWTKAFDCSRGKENVRIILFIEESYQDTIYKKQKIRALFPFGKHSIHISDTHDETMDICRQLLNENSVHFLNNAIPYSFPNTISNLSNFKNEIENDKNLIDSFAITASTVLSVYGLRDNADIDVISELDCSININGVDVHNKYSNFFNNSINELIRNPEHYFYYHGLKFISLMKLLDFKRERNEFKDNADIVMIEGLLGGGDKFILQYLSRIYFKMLFLYLKLFNFILNVLRYFRLYNSIRFLYRRFRKVIELIFYVR